MSSTAVRYLTMLRMVPRYPRSITTTELASRLEEQGFSVTMRSIQRDLEKLSADFPLLVDENSRPYRWSFDRNATMDIIPALDLPAALTFELEDDEGRRLCDALPKAVSAITALMPAMDFVLAQACAASAAARELAEDAPLLFILAVSDSRRAPQKAPSPGLGASLRRFGCLPG